MAKKRDFIVTAEEYAYGYIINALAGGLYPNKFHVLREYIQNGYDAIANWKATRRRAKCRIKIVTQKPSIFVYDDGTGMDRHTLNEYRKVGFSKKLVGEFAGFRGIGKLAGVSVAKKLIVLTSVYGVNEKYTLTFDCEAMLREVDELKQKRENISLNKLIEKHTELTSDTEKRNTHYTVVELHDIRSDSKILFDTVQLAHYISRNAPVPFNPDFEHATEIEQDILQFVEDYDRADISLDGKKIYKPFAHNLKQPKHIIVWGGKSRDERKAFCWYSENAGKGQVRPTDISGLVYRYKNFAVGDNYLTRKTIWRTSPHLAFYFMGEVYITEPKIMPTSQRDDFEQSEERDDFYEDAKVIANELNRIARTSSGVRRAHEYVTKGASIVSTIDKEIKRKEPYLRDLSVEKIAQLSNVVTDIDKRKRNIPDEDKKTKMLAKRVVTKAKGLLDEFERVGKAGRKEFDIVNKLNLGKESAKVYNTVIRTLKDLYVNRPDEMEKIIKAIHRNLMKTFKRKRAN